MPDTSRAHEVPNAAIGDAMLVSPVPPVPPVPPGPPPRTKLGTIANQLQFFVRPIATVSRRFARYGDIYRVVSATEGGSALFVTRDPDYIKDILVTNAAAFDKQHPAFRQLARVLGDALVTSDGERWRRQRRLVQPAFAKPRLVQYCAAMTEETERVAERLRRGGEFNISREMNQLTLAIVARTLFGQRLESTPTARAMVELNRWFMIPPVFLRFIPRAQQRFDAVVQTFDRLMDQVIENKRVALQRDPDLHPDLLSSLITARDEDGEQLSPRELRDQLLTLYLAGHETVTQALTWALYLLSLHPEIGARLTAEHARVLGTRAPRYEDLASLPYTECVIKEALRLYPPAYIIPRNVREDTTVGPYRVPKGSEVAIWIYATHRDPRWFPEPDQFRPERFEPEHEAARPKYAYLPFGAGQRACIGQLFAMFEAQLILATLWPRLSFEFTGRRPARPKTAVTLAPRGGMPMRVRPR